MKPMLAVAPLLLALPILSACGEKSPPPQITVTGRAKIEKVPELFGIEARILERSKDRQQSLKAASRKLAELRDKLAHLKGLVSVEIESEDVRAHTIRPGGCDPDKEDTYEPKKYPASCAPLDYLASIKVSIEGEPAAAAGSAISLLSQLNVETVSSLSYRVKDPAAARDEARQAALTNAMQIARALAKKAGADISGPLEIKNADSGVDFIIVTGSRTAVAGEATSAAPKIVPEVTLDLPTEKVTFRADVTAKFALQKPKARK